MSNNKHTSLVNGMDRGKITPKNDLQWYVIHHVSKPIIINSVGYLYGAIKPTIERKFKEGWANPEMEILWNNWQEVVEMDYPVSEDVDGKYDHIRQFYDRLGKIMCTLLDEDSHFLLRFFYFIEVLYRDYPKYRIAMHKERAYWHWETIMEGIREEHPDWENNFNNRPTMEAIENGQKILREQNNPNSHCTGCTCAVRSVDRR